MRNVVSKLNILILVVLGSVYFSRISYAQNVNLTQYVVGPVGHSHQLSTGETISYTNEGGAGPGSPVRMYKNSNYEQFYLAGDGIYRREDTSWAPHPGFVNSNCLDGPNPGQKAVYTIHRNAGPFAPGTNMGAISPTDGAKWAPNSASLGSSWTDTFSVVPISGVGDLAAGRFACTADFNPGNGIQTSVLQYRDYYGPNTFTFCTGVSNPEPLILIEILSGPGTGDTFYFMKNYGLVGFEAPGFQAGLMGPGADPSNCDTSGAGSSGAVTVIKGALRGFYNTTTTSRGNTVERSDTPVQNAILKIYEGEKFSPNGKQQGLLINPPEAIAAGLNSTVRTDEDGYFEIEMRRGSGRNNLNYLVIFCSNTGIPADNIASIYALDSRRSLDGLILNEDCPENVDTPDPPETLDYVNKDDILSCEVPSLLDTVYSIYSKFNQLARGVTTRINLNQVFDNTWSGASLDSVPNSQDDVRTDDELFRGDAWGRFSTNLMALNPLDMFGSLTCLVQGCPEGVFLPRRGESVPVPDCSVYSDANKPLKARNMFGFAQNLASPSFNTRSEDVQRYITVMLIDDIANTPVCSMGGSTYQFRQFLPPINWDRDEINAATGGRLCTSNCLDPSYFPLNILYSLNKKAMELDQSTSSPNDSVDSIERDRRFIVTNEGETLSCDMSGDTCATQPRAFADRNAVAIPEGVSSPVSAANAVTRGALNKTIASPPEILFDPKTQEQEDELAQGKMPKRYQTVSLPGNGLIRIGKPKALCICPWPLRVANLCNNLTTDAELMNFFTNVADTFLYGAGYTYATERNVTAEGLARFFTYPVDWLSAILLDIYNFFQAPWWNPDGTRNPYEKEGQCQGGWTGATEAEAATLPENVTDPACLTSNGCGNYRCTGWIGSGANILCNSWDIYRWNYSCTPNAELPDLDPDLSVSLPTKGLTTGMMNFAFSLYDPMAWNPRYNDAMVTGTEATGATANQAAGTDLKLSESFVAYMDQLQKSVGDPTFFHKKFSLRRQIKKAGTIPALPPVDDPLCQFGTNSPFRTIPELPDALIEVLEVAGDAYATPGPMLLAAMFAEGSLNYGSVLASNLTDDNVLQWIIEGPSMEEVGDEPYCDPNDSSAQRPFNIVGSGWDYLSGLMVQPNSPYRRDFPTRVPNKCNLLDQAYAIAIKLNSESAATTTGEGRCPADASDPNCNICFGEVVSGGTSRPNSCGEWNLTNLAISGRQFAGWCFDNENSGTNGFNYRNGPASTPPENRQDINVCFRNRAACISEPSHIFNIMDIFRFYALPNLRNRILANPHNEAP